MGKSHHDVVHAFFATPTKCYTGSRVFADFITREKANAELFSHGRHFSLAVRRTAGWEHGHWFLLNGDKYSISTSTHQSITYSAGRNWPRVSFTALWAAGIDRYTCTLIDFVKDGSDYARVGDEKFADFKRHMPIGAEYHEKKDDDGNVIMKSYHRIGAVVLEQLDKHFICAMDEGSYFISLLPEQVTSVAEAFDALKPQTVRDVIAQGDSEEVLRQGENFFIPKKCLLTFPPLPKEKDWLKSSALPTRDSNSNTHVCTRLYVYPDGVTTIAKGWVRHKNRWGRRADHAPINLGKEPHLVLRNRSLGDWSSGGYVD